MGYARSEGLGIPVHGVYIIISVITSGVTFVKMGWGSQDWYGRLRRYGQAQAQRQN
jgi:hypothetical protein